MDIRADVQEPFSYTFTPTRGTARFFRLIPPPPPAPPIRVLLIGDSMAADCCGWGQGMYGYFKPEATFVNYATPWASTKVFLQSAELEKMLLIEPNYVLMQYGFIDAGGDPDRSTSDEEYRANLMEIVETVRGFSGVPILVTLHAPRLWDENGKILPSPGWEARNALTRQIAAELETPLIDLYELSKELFNELGPAGTEFMRYAPGDPMHFSYLGGVWISQLVAQNLPDALAPYLTGTFDPPPNP